MRRLAVAVGSAARSTAAALIGLLVDDAVLVIGIAGAMMLMWALLRIGWLPPGARGFVLLGLVVATLAVSLRRAARVAASRPE